jgi:hypothetical protein
VDQDLNFLGYVVVMRIIQSEAIVYVVNGSRDAALSFGLVD